ncbi:sulfurtransferase TusA family protein [Cohaesibacter celericrescens]|uniref:UPF0033 domain-containing protein n=1 Tax=Cohaesibacter celericrescens TaxID=2067669 RepID=A0A2N5XUG5_9HYPH|nr:sulfurtransferase TusA family protein [Cohaesibacter celericrescens]PLW78085.1 hypothetical protein C0081_06440 [Cohaesibacter celericrescens]
MHDLDLSGLKCPLPVLRTQKALKDLPKGSRIAILTTDPMAALDLPHFCSEHDHLLIDTQQRGPSTLWFLIEK